MKNECGVSETIRETIDFCGQVFGNRKNEKISIQMREWNEQQQKRVGVRECLIEGKTTRGE